MDHPPRRGDWFNCRLCGMELLITRDCHRAADEPVPLPVLKCCGQVMAPGAYHQPDRPPTAAEEK